MVVMSPIEATRRITKHLGSRGDFIGRELSVVAVLRRAAVAGIKAAGNNFDGVSGIIPPIKFT